MRILIAVSSVVVWLGSSVFAAQTPAVEPSAFGGLYGELLQKYRHEPGVVNGVFTSVFDFARMSTDAREKNSLFQRTLSAFERTDVARIATESDLKAFWMNAYNFAAMKIVVENYPIKSIRDRKVSLFKYPWSQKVIRSGGEMLSLKGIEQGILLKQFNDPRIVFAVNCMTISCPDLAPEPFDGNRLETQLDELMRAFLTNQSKGLSIDTAGATIRVSWIFDKHEELIRREMGGLKGVVHRYLDPSTCDWMERFGSRARIQYMEHDWTLNDSALVERRIGDRKN